MLFLDRHEESTRLARFFDSAAGGICCLYGRRRCGKTRLLRECTRTRPDCIHFIADRTERRLQMLRFIQECPSKYSVLSAAHPDNWGSILDLWITLSPPGAILILDEFPYLVEKDASLPSILQRISDSLADNGHKIVICGSSQSMMQGFVLKASEPLYGRAKEILPIMPLQFEWLKQAFPKMPPMERLKAWAVWGGVPRYWELQSDSPDVWSAVRRNIASPLGVLRNEPHFLLQDDVSDTAKSASVLAFIGNGAHRLSEIAARLGRVATDLSRPIQRLTELGLVKRETPFASEDNGKKSNYIIADPFLEFWYTYIWPNWSREDFLESLEERQTFDHAFRPFLGLVWERLIRTSIIHADSSVSDITWHNCSRWWGNGLDHRPMELDVVAESADGKTLLVGEAKLSLAPQEQERELEKLRQKASLLPFSQKYKSIVEKLFVANDMIAP